VATHLRTESDQLCLCSKFFFIAACAALKKQRRSTAGAAPWFGEEERTGGVRYSAEIRASTIGRPRLVRLVGPG
jgi:hypothetical protein